MFPSLYFEIVGGDDQFNYSFEAKAHGGAFDIQSHALEYFGLCDGGPENDSRLAHHEFNLQNGPRIIPIRRRKMGLVRTSEH